MGEKKSDEAHAASAIGTVLKPGQIKASEEDAPPWWRFYAVIGGATAVGLMVLGVVGFMGRSTPPKGPTLPPAPEQMVALDLDDVSGDALGRPLRLSGAGVVPVQKVAAKTAARGGGGRARKAHGGGPLPKVEGPAEPEKKKPSGAIIYRPSGPG